MSKLKKVKRFIKYNFLMIILLALGFILRVDGIYFDYPYGVNYVWDETCAILPLISAMEKKSLFALISPYPLLITFLYVPGVVLRLIYLAIRENIYNIADLKNFLIANGIGQLYIIIRWYSVLFGTATIYFLYKIYEIVFNKKSVAYYVALVYAVSMLPVSLAHWGKVHTIMVFFSILALYFVLRFEKNKKINDYYFSVVAATCAVSSHYIGATSFIFPLLGFLYNKKLFNKKYILKSLSFFSLLIFLFYITNYQGIKKMVIKALGIAEQTGYTALHQVDIFERFYYVFRDLFYIEPLFVSLFIVLLIFNLKKYLKHQYIKYIIFGLFFNYFLMTTIFTGPGLIRYLLSFFTLLISFSAGAFFDLAYKKLNKNVLYIISLFFVIPTFIVSIFWLRILNIDTRFELVKWLENNLSVDEVAYTFDHHLDTQLSYDAALYHREVNKVNSSKKVNYIIKNKDIYKDKGINLRYDLGNNRYEELGGVDTKYIIIYYFHTDKTKDIYLRPMKEKAYKILDNIKKYHDIELVKTFYPTDDEDLIRTGVSDYINNPISWRTILKLDKSGSFMEIYEVKDKKDN